MTSPSSMSIYARGIYSASDFCARCACVWGGVGTEQQRPWAGRTPQQGSGRQSAVAHQRGNGPKRGPGLDAGRRRSSACSAVCSSCTGHNRGGGSEGHGRAGVPAFDYSVTGSTVKWLGRTLKKISLPSWVATLRLMVSTSGLVSSAMLVGVESEGRGTWSERRQRLHSFC